MHLTNNTNFPIRREAIHIIKNQITIQEGIFIMGNVDLKKLGRQIVIVAKQRDFPNQEKEIVIDLSDEGRLSFSTRRLTMAYAFA